MRNTIKIAVSVFLLLLAGCPAMKPSESNTPVNAGDQATNPDASVTDTAASGTDPDSTLARVTETLDANLKHRSLSSVQHGGWQILHGILAYGQDFVIDTPDGPKPAVDYMRQGGSVAGFDPIIGDEFELADGTVRRGLRMELQPATKIGQGHRDQWLAVLAQSGLKASDTIQYDEHRFTMDDWVRQVQYDIPENVEQEFSWTLIGLLAYRDTDHRWTSRDGTDYNIEVLLSSELEKELIDSACGGTHRLIGIAKALNKRRAEGKPITGTWKQAENTLAAALNQSKQNQNPDGSFSVQYHHRTGWTRDMGESLGTTGHVLEMIATAANPATLRQPWVGRSVHRLCDILDQCNDVDLECGVLYHALHGLVEYQHKVFAGNDS